MFRPRSLSTLSTMDNGDVSYVPIIDLDNEIEAQLITAHLTDQEIPHRIKTRHDPAYAGIFQVQMGWGFIEAPEQYRAAIAEVYEDLTGKRSE